jgi:hypothetical protein
MNKAAIASLLALSAFTVAPAAFSHRGAAYAQQVTMDAAEFADYDAAFNKQTTPQTQAPALEAYLAKYPKSSVRKDVLQRIMLDYSQFDPAKAITAADNFLAVDPANLQAYLIEVAYRKQAAEAATDPAAKGSGLDAAATFAKKGLDVTKAPAPAGVTPADYQKIVDIATPTFYGAIGEAAMNNKDGVAAVAAYKAELAAIKPDQLTQPASLQEAFFLAQAYRLLTPPDYTNCAFYATRAATLAPAQFQAALQPTATYCYKKQHGSAEGYDAVVAAAKSNANPPDGFAIAPAPTDKDIADGLMKTTADADIPKLATGDKEFVLANASPENAAKVWDSVKGKSFQIPGALVIESSPTVLKVAISDDAVQGKKADYTFNLKPLEAPEEPKAKTPVALAAYKKAKAAYDKQVAEIADATAVGKTVTLQGTYSSYTPNPIMIIMDDGEVILPKATPAPKAPVHTAPRHK